MSVSPEPVRTCVGCRGTDRKPALVRLVVDAAGRVVVDPRGTAAGRGAYLHPRSTCVEEALRRGSLARALRTGLDREGAVRLKTDIEHVGRQAGSP